MQHLRSRRLHSRTKTSSENHNVKRLSSLGGRQGGIFRHELSGDDGLGLLPAREHDISQHIGIATDLLTFFEQSGTHDLSRTIQNRGQGTVIQANLVSTLQRVSFCLFGSDFLVVYDNKVEMNFGRIVPDSLQMLPGTVVISFTRLRH